MNSTLTLEEVERKLSELDNPSKQDVLKIVEEYLGITIPEITLSELPCKFSYSIAICYCTEIEREAKEILFEKIIKFIASILELCYEDGNEYELEESCNCGTKILVKDFTLSDGVCNV